MTEMIFSIAHVTRGVIPKLQDTSLSVVQGVLVHMVNCWVQFMCRSCVPSGREGLFESCKRIFLRTRARSFP